MLTSLKIRNFKAWQDTGKIPLAPLTVIFGTNSAGKSSLGHLLLALKQTALATDRKRALHLGDANSLIDLGTFKDCLYKHQINSELEFDLAWKLPKSINVRDLHNRNNQYTGDELSLSASLKADKKEQPEIQKFKYELRNDKESILSIEHSLRDGNWCLESGVYAFTMAQGRKWNLTEPDKFYRISEKSISRYQNADFLVDFALEVERMLAGISYLGPLREHPKRIYQWSGDTPEDVGQQGELAISAILAAQENDRKINRGRGMRTKQFAQFIAELLVEMKVIDSFDVKPVAEGRKEFEVLVKTHQGAPEVKITDVGFGVSQVLPALVQAFYCPPNSTVWMEQPEIHLHPQAQSVLADVFIYAVNSYEKNAPRNIQLIVESHSEHFLTRLQRLIAEGHIDHKDVAIYFCRNASEGAVLELLEIDLFGEIKNWPENFFGDQFGDVTARTKAAILKRQRGGR